MTPLLAPNMLTTKEVAKRHHVVDRTVRHAIKRGWLHAERVGWGWLIHLQDALLWKPKRGRRGTRKRAGTKRDAR